MEPGCEKGGSPSDSFVGPAGGEGYTYIYRGGEGYILIYGGEGYIRIVGYTSI